jgi:gluconolactonase
MDVEVDVRHDQFIRVAGPNLQLEQIASDFAFTEGPVWHPYDKYLVFSDIICNTLYRWSQAEGVTVYRRPSYLANGNTYDRQGRLLTCEHGTSRVSRQNPDPQGAVEVVASHYQGRQLNSPNDIVVKSDGAIYLTDPNPGRGPRVGIPRPQELPFQGVYRLGEDGSLTLLVDDLPKPNGLCFSLDEQRLFVNDSDRGHIYAFDMLPDGTLANADSGSDNTLWAELTNDGLGVADGMKFDREGNLYCCGPGGIHLFDPEGNYLGVIRMPEQTANLAWGDEDFRSLYITASTTLYRLRVQIAGSKLF